MKNRNYIFVLNSKGQPLMPCSWNRARRLLSSGKAEMVRADIPTIRLLVPSSGYRQKCSLGVDLGARHVGISVTTDRRELFSVEAVLLDGIKKRLTKRREQRRGRRFRKTRYRKARFDNRVATKKEGWLPPTQRNRVEATLSVIRRVTGILPVSKIVCEGGRFDTQAVMNPEIEGSEYQRGPQYSFDNVKAYVRWRDGYACTECCATGKEARLEVHHIVQRKDGGSDRPSNLTTLCHECHRRHHEEGMPLHVKRPKDMKGMSAMNIISGYIIGRVKVEYGDVMVTWGWKTERERRKTGLPKSHVNDAYVMAGNLRAERLTESYVWRKIRRHDRRLHDEVPKKEGKRKSQASPRWIGGNGVERYQKYDRVKVNCGEGFVWGSTNGYLYVRDINGKPTAGVRTAISPKKVRLKYRHRGGYVIDKIIKNDNKSLLV